MIDDLVKGSTCRHSKSRDEYGILEEINLIKHALLERKLHKLYLMGQCLGCHSKQGKDINLTNVQRKPESTFNLRLPGTLTLVQSFKFRFFTE